MNTTAIKLVIKLWHDDAPENPCDVDGWKAYSFNSRHSNFRHPDDFENARFKLKVERGLAFPLSYFEHGQCLWSLASELPPGANCPWDSVSYAGVLVWEQKAGNLGPKTFEDRQKDARGFVERYTNWCNGEVYGYTVEAVTPCVTCGKVEETDEVDFDLPSCGGYYPDDIEGMAIDIKDHIGEGWEDYEVEFKEHPYASGLADRVKGLWKEGA